MFWPETPPSDYASTTALSLALRPRAFQASAEDVAGLSGFLAEQSRRYASLEVPVLLIHGTHDRVVPAWNHPTRTLKQYPKAELVLLPGAGHGLHHTRVEAIATAITGWLNSNGTRRTTSVGCRAAGRHEEHGVGIRHLVSVVIFRWPGGTRKATHGTRSVGTGSRIDIGYECHALVWLQLCPESQSFSRKTAVRERIDENPAWF